MFIFRLETVRDISVQYSSAFFDIYETISGFLNVKNIQAEYYDGEHIKRE